MSKHHDIEFEESLFSGYLDGELTQADEQRVRLHLEEDPEARRLVAEMQSIREAARSTRLAVPPDDEWDEAPRSTTSSWFRRTGWTLVVGWGIVLLALTVWGLVMGPASWWEKLLATAAVGGPVLLFLSVLIDRVRVMKHDRYRRVKK